MTYSAATRGPVAKPPRSTRVTTALGDTSRSSLRYAACLPSSEGWFSAACLSRLSFLLRRLSPKGHTKSRTWRARDWRYGPLEVTATVPSPEGSATGTASFASPAPSPAPRPTSWSSSRPSPPSAEGPASSDPAALHDSDSRRRLGSPALAVSTKRALLPLATSTGRAIRFPRILTTLADPPTRPGGRFRYLGSIVSYLPRSPSPETRLPDLPRPLVGLVARAAPSGAPAATQRDADQVDFLFAPAEISSFCRIPGEFGLSSNPFHKKETAAQKQASAARPSRRQTRGEGARATSRTQTTETERTVAEGRMTISLTVQPRVQREKWSLYWKESMMTKTDVLDPVVLSVDENKTKVGSGDSEHSSASTRSSRNDPPGADD